MSAKRPMTAAELMAKLQADPKFRRRESHRERKREERQEAYARQLGSVMQELCDRGFDGESLQDIVKKHAPLPEDAVEVLLSSVSQLTESRPLESVVRALGAAETPFDGRALVDCFERTSDEALKWAVVNTVAHVRPHSIDDWLSELQANPYWGQTLRELGMDP